MKKIIFLFFVPYIIFSQENISFNLFNEYSYFSRNNETVPENKFINSLFPISVLLADAAINIGMREGIYRNNYQNNWWGTVNGALTLGLGGTLIGYGISYGIYKITNEKFNENNILIGSLLGLAGGVTMAFFPPFKQAFRENAFLYYSFPTLFAVGITFVIIDEWIGNDKKQNINFQFKQNSLIFQLRL